MNRFENPRELATSLITPDMLSWGFFKSLYLNFGAPNRHFVKNIVHRDTILPITKQQKLCSKIIKLINGCEGCREPICYLINGMPAYKFIVNNLGMYLSSSAIKVVIENEQPFGEISGIPKKMVRPRRRRTAVKVTPTELPGDSIHNIESLKVKIFNNELFSSVFTRIRKSEEEGKVHFFTSLMYLIWESNSLPSQLEIVTEFEYIPMMVSSR